jgi:hypothetical protein
MELSTGINSVYSDVLTSWRTHDVTQQNKKRW